MSLKSITSKNNSKSNLNTKCDQIDVLKILEAENCCSNTSIYEISYHHIARKWLVCNKCLYLDFFKNDIKEKVRIKV